MTYKFLIYISYPYSIPIGEPLEEEILKQGHQIRWFSELEETKSYFKETSLLLNTIKEALAYEPHIILTATDTVPDFFDGLKVQIFHGFPANKRSFKKDHFRIRSFFDLYTTHGPSTTKIFKELAQQYKTFDVIETGWSKIDMLFKEEKANQKEDKPVILISSTFTKRLSLAYDQQLFEAIKQLSQSGQYTFLCVLHPKLPSSVKEKFISLEGNDFSYFDTPHLSPLFRRADIMLSDTTSAISEFIMQRKPVVTYRTNKLKPYLINIQDASELLASLQYALTNPKEILNEIDGYIKETHPYTDGNSSARVINACISFLHRDKKHLKNKPWNLVRKWKLRKNLGYFTWKSYNKPKTM